MANDKYLTMARIMDTKYHEWKKENVWGKGYTGLVEIALKQAYQEGFMAGFSGRYFNTEE